MKTKKKTKKKGFTLIELLVVIAIIAILSVVVVLTLNPAEMLRRSRDSNRASDLSIIKTAISLYLADVSTTAMGTSAYCYSQYGAGGATGNTPVEFPPAVAWSATATTTGTLAFTAASVCAPWFPSATAANAGGASSSRAVTGGGWIPINLSAISSGAPIGQWPVDPAYSAGTVGQTGQSSAGHFYSYVTTSTNNAYKLAAKMESALYTDTGSGDLESTDGGSDLNMYEQGTNLAL